MLCNHALSLVVLASSNQKEKGKGMVHWSKDDNALYRYAMHNERAHGQMLWKNGPHYFTVYHRVLRHLQRDTRRKITMLELGVNTGGAIGMWKHYFGHDRLVYHGVDINPNCSAFHDPAKEVHIHIGSQDNVSFLNDVVRQAGGIVDFVNDDASHWDPLTIRSFEILYSSVSQDQGVYLIEDLHPTSTKWWKYLERLHLYLQRPFANPRITSGFVSTSCAKKCACGPAGVLDFCRVTAGIMCTRAACAFEKRPPAAAEFYQSRTWGNATTFGKNAYQEERLREKQLRRSAQGDRRGQGASAGISAARAAAGSST